MILSIFLQILIGISALLIVYLDYKWYDKRKNAFKKVRRYLIMTTFLIIGLSVFTTIRQAHEKRNLLDNIASLTDRISSVNTIAISLNNQIKPFLNLAMEKYPNLPINEALKKLEFGLVDLQMKTKELELNEQISKSKEVELQRLKSTPPDVDFYVSLINNDLKIFIKFNNQVPIKFYPFLIYYGPWECGTTKFYKIFTKAYIEAIVLYPPKDKNEVLEFIYDTIEKGEELPRDKLLCLRMKITYSSIFVDEIQTLKLRKKEVLLDYTIEPFTYEFKSTKFIER